MQAAIQLVVNNRRKQISLKEYNGQRVVTFNDIDNLHERPTGTASRNFSQNKKHFVKNEDFYWMSPQEMQYTNIVNYKSPKGLTLLNESGYLMLVKSFQDDLAWDVQRHLVKTYFRAKEELDASQLSPELQILNNMFKALAKAEMETKQLSQRVDQADEKIESIKDIVSFDPNDWRDDVNKIFNKIVIQSGGSFRDLRKDSYQELEKRAKCNLSVRLKNMQTNMKLNGASKTKVNQKNKMDVIEEDNKLTEIYLSIIKNMAIKYQITL